MKLLTIALALVGMTLVQTVHAQDFDPTEQILPFETEAQLIADWRYQDAVGVLDAKLTTIEQSMWSLSIDWSTIESDDPRFSRWLTAFTNFSLAYHLRCHALAGIFDSPQSSAACVADWDAENRDLWCAAAYDSGIKHGDMERCIKYDLASEESWTPHFQGLSLAIILEAEGRFDDAMEALRGNGIFFARVADFEDFFSGRRYRVTSASSLIQDYMQVRRNRLRLMTQDDGQLSGGSWSNLRDCPTGREVLCPAANSVLRGIREFVTGFRYGASDFLNNVLDRPQHWLGLDPYEHPLFWIAALSHTEDQGTYPGDVFEHADVFGTDLSPDVAYVIGLFKGDIQFDGAVPDRCDTAGCRYFVAQYLYGLGRVADGHVIITESQELCAGTESLMCAVLQHAQAKIEAGGQP
ncbi:MAG: hypothetical protein AAF563_00640 [Pseudomonadota bacterium]